MCQDIKIQTDYRIQTKNMYINMESRTNKMAFVRSREHKICKTKWNFSCQSRWLLISHATLVQEGNYLSHAGNIWQRDTPKICTCDPNNHVCKRGPPITRLLRKLPIYYQECQAEQPCTTHRLLGKFHTWHQGCRDIYQKDREGWNMALSRCN